MAQKSKILWFASIVFAVNLFVWDVMAADEKKDAVETRASGDSVNSSTPYFPLNKSSYWIYEGDVAWADEKGETHNEKISDWKMEVVEVINRERFNGYKVIGHPHDLAWQNGEQERKTTIIIQAGERLYYQIHPRNWEEIKQDKERLKPPVNEEQLILQFPMKEGDMFAFPLTWDEKAREERIGSYHWIVESEGSCDFISSSGYRFNGKKNGLLYPTLSDHILFEFAPGLGIVSYLYSHHGSTCEVNMRLKDFHLE